MLFVESYTITTWESPDGDINIEHVHGSPDYVVKVWGLDPPAFTHNGEIPRQLGWQPTIKCATLQEAMQAATRYAQEREENRTTINEIRAEQGLTPLP